MKQTRAFTVLEILVVVGIITILATIGLSSYSSVQKKSRDARRTSDLELVRAAIEQYRSNNNDYPVTLTSPLCDPSGCGTGTYLSKIPVDPIASQKYWYQRNSSSDYTLCAYLSNPGTSSSGNCATSGSLVCNYCLGPYGVK